MKNKKIIVLSASVLAILVILAIAGTIIYRNSISTAKATTMRLLRIVGEVTLEDEGQLRTIIDNLRLADGNAISTADKSLASIGLDESKIINIEENSRAEFFQDGKKLKLNLTKGRLFFDVRKPLDENESLDIKSSTMMVGIRGTSGYIWIDESTGRQYLYITDGHVTVEGYNPVTGKTELKEVGPGQMLTALLNDDGTFSTFTLESVSVDQLPTELLREFCNDQTTYERVIEACGYDEILIFKLIEADPSSSYITVALPTPITKEPEETLITPVPTKPGTTTPTPTPTPTSESEPMITKAPTPVPTAPAAKGKNANKTGNGAASSTNALPVITTAPAAPAATVPNTGQTSSSGNSSNSGSSDSDSSSDDSSSGSDSSSDSDSSQSAAPAQTSRPDNATNTVNQTNTPADGTNKESGADNNNTASGSDTASQSTDNSTVGNGTSGTSTDSGTTDSGTSAAGTDSGPNSSSGGNETNNAGTDPGQTSNGTPAGYDPTGAGGP